MPAPGPRTLPVPATCLVILDGWGLAAPGPGNAVALADTPVFDALWDSYPHTTLIAGGRAVGLPEGQMGNSEVGHLNLGAGAVVPQDLTRIDDAVQDGSLAENSTLREALDAPRVHLLGLASDGGVHSGWKHLEALVGVAASSGVADLVIHAFTDGRDTPPTSGAGHLAILEGWCAQAGTGRVASVVGRYFAMDRDTRWDRTALAYDLLVHGRGERHANTAAEAAHTAYAAGETDEFIRPTLVGDQEGRIRPRDSVICFNFRPDRMRQLVRALAEPAFAQIGRGGAAAVEHLTTLTEYEEGWPYPVVFPPVRPRTTLAEVVAATGARQLHVAETEKYPHVTYFFNGGQEDPVAGERRELVPSPRDVPTYDHRPEMSAHAAARAFVRAWQEDEPRFAIINFANPDMVGHTGVIPAAVRAVETGPWRPSTRAWERWSRRCTRREERVS
jgi:2,3-bisphosphoglycerate-independent phosphoglycerate mutase